MDDFSSQENPKGIKFGVIRISSICQLQNTVEMFSSGQELLPIDGGHVKSFICTGYIRDWDWKG